MTRMATTWGIGSTQFLWLYGGLCAALAAAIWHVRRRALGGDPAGKDPAPDLGIYKTAMLNGGPQLAITTAATQLHRQGVLAAGVVPRTHVVAGVLAPHADRLEGAVFEAVRGEPGISTSDLRGRLAASEPVRRLTDELTECGLLLDKDVARQVRRLWLWVLPLVALGAVGLLIGIGQEAVGYLAIMVAAACAGALWLFRRRGTTATARGRELVRARRRERGDLQRSPVAAESALAVALFGSAALWLADPALATTLDVPREDESSLYRGGGGCSSAGSCSGVVGGCGGGGGGGGGCGGCGGCG